MRDPVYRGLRAKVQALLDRDAPKDVVLIEVDWSRVEQLSPRAACIARNDIDGRYNVWTIDFEGTEPSSIHSGRYDIALTTAAADLDRRLWN